MTGQHAQISRRLVLGSVAAGAVAWTAGGPLTAHAEALTYDSPAAFDVAEQAYFDQGFTDNETGGYAWGASYYLLGLLRMYEAYGKVDYLDRFVDYADHVLSTTDRARGVTDYAGRSGPVWRTSGAYTASHGVIVGPDGHDAIQLRWAGARGAESTAQISDVAGDTFTLTLRNPATTTVVTLTSVSLDPASARYVVTAINDAYTPAVRWTAKDLRESPSAQPAPAAATIAFDSQFYVFAVHTGMVAYPLSKYVRIVLGSRKLCQGRHHRHARRILTIVRKTVAFHDHEFHVRPDGIGDYVWPKGAPIPFDGTIQPYNQTGALGQAMAELYRITHDHRYKNKVLAMQASYRHGLTENAAGAYSWPYWPVHGEMYAGFTAAQGISTYTPSYTPSRQVEDISHAAISIEFALAAEKADIGNWTADMGKFARTYTENVIRSDTEVWFRVDGTGDAVAANAVQCARWGAYAEFDAEIYHQALAVYDAVQLVPNQGSHALGIAYLNWGKQEGWKA